MSRTPWAPEPPVGLGGWGGPPGFSVSRSEEGRSSSGSANIKDSLNPFTEAWGAHRDREGVSPPSPDSGSLLCPHAPRLRALQVEGSLRWCRWWAGPGRARCWAVTCCPRLAGPLCMSSSGCALDSCFPSSSSLASTLPASTLITWVRLVLL